MKQCQLKDPKKVFVLICLATSTLSCNISPTNTFLENHTSLNDEFVEASPDTRSPNLENIDEKYSKCKGIEIWFMNESEIRDLVDSRKLTSSELRSCYLERLSRMNSVLKVANEMNPDAMLSPSGEIEPETGFNNNSSDDLKGSGVVAKFFTMMSTLKEKFPKLNTYWGNKLVNLENSSMPSDDTLTNISNDQVPSTNNPDVAIGQEITLTSGEIYRVRCPELGDFHVRAGATGRFRVKAATLIISKEQNIIFPDHAVDLVDGAEAEVKDNLAGTTTITVFISPPKKQSRLSSMFATVTFGVFSKEDEISLQVVGSVDEFIQVSGLRPTVINITGNGGHLVFSGPKTATVHGSLQSVQNKGTGNVNLNGNVTEGVWQTGSGSIVISGDLNGTISNTGGGSIEVTGLYTGNTQHIYNARGSVSIGPFSGGIRMTSYSGYGSGWPGYSYGFSGSRYSNYKFLWP